MSKLREIEKYWDIRSEGFSKGVLDEIEIKADEWMSKLEGLLSDIRGKKILDIGCGPGFFTMLLSDMGYKVTAFDFSEDMLNEAKKNMAARGGEAEFIRGDAQCLPFEDECFDGIVSRNLTWNLEKPECAYSEWLRVLKRGGILINCDGNHYSHYYKKEYLLEKLQPEYIDVHNPEYIKDIDMSVIDNIAIELPLSKEIRPSWDINILIDMGAAYVGAEIIRKKFTDAEGKEHNIIKDFILKAIK